MQFWTARPHYRPFRIGLHMGEVHRRGGDVFGHAINVAARVQSHGRARRRLRDPGRLLGGPQRGPLGLSLRRPAGAEEHARAAGALSRRPTNGGEPPEERSSCDLVIDGLGALRGDGEAIALRSAKAQALIGYLALSSNLPGRAGPHRGADLARPQPGSVPAARMANCLQVAEKSIDEQRLSSYSQPRQFHGSEPLADHRRRGAHAATISPRARSTTCCLAARTGSTPSSRAGGYERPVQRVAERDAAQLARTCAGGAGGDARPLCHRRTGHAQGGERAPGARAQPRAGARCLIRHHAETQNVSAAMRVYENLRDFLRDRFHMAPGPETTALVEALKDRTEPVAAAAGTQADGPAPTLPSAVRDAEPERHRSSCPASAPS